MRLMTRVDPPAYFNANKSQDGQHSCSLALSESTSAAQYRGGQGQQVTTSTD